MAASLLKLPPPTMAYALSLPRVKKQTSLTVAASRAGSVRRQQHMYSAVLG